MGGLIDFGLVNEPVDGTKSVVALQGEVDAHTAPKLGSCLFGLAEEGKKDVIVDLSDVTFLDSTGIGVLVHALQALLAASRAHGAGLPHRARAASVPDRGPGGPPDDLRLAREGPRRSRLTLSRLSAGARVLLAELLEALRRACPRAAPRRSPACRPGPAARARGPVCRRRRAAWARPAPGPGVGSGSRARSSPSAPPRARGPTAGAGSGSSGPVRHRRRSRPPPRPAAAAE